MFRPALIIARKDLRLIAGRRGGLLQALLLGLLLIFMFSLSLAPGQVMSPQGAATVFWMSSSFCQVLIFNMLHSHEEENGQMLGLLLSPIPIQSIWLGKALAGVCLLLLAQLVFLPAVFVFLRQEAGALWLVGLASIIVSDIGTAALGALLGAFARGQSAREALFSILVFPLLTPLFLGGIRIGAAVLGPGAGGDYAEWLGISLAFDAIFIAAALFLFPLVYNVDD
ncbi:MAG: heme exporter protein CcmB [Desulfovibrio sp.]|jgi:heme exporter protein B|nr:heme exporter protein CcmB [Desulfovibrio sp.]